MTWTDLTQNWGVWFNRMKSSRFPHLDESAMPFVKLDRARFEAYIADTHQLTLTEAREEFEDFLYVEALAREAIDLRARADA
ncbi:hypothetical protein [Thalassococcus sp. S3]|uniref:hypothetical protein n=1 Tax=Thalassococcus sp. S3 TaxID=2017482 RepID=UPI00102462F4|nr:hypothetical protein [Thalassococcus sp. S3]QBF31758.1 hypothetical protein CFI11_11070 [Thalassococcus sp. S3]